MDADGSAWKAHVLTDDPPVDVRYALSMGRLNGHRADLSACMSARIRLLLDIDYSETRPRDWTISNPEKRPLSRPDIAAAFGLLRHHLYHCIMLRRKFTASPSLAVARRLVRHWRESRRFNRMILESFVGLAVEVVTRMTFPAHLVADYCQEAQIGLATAVDYFNPQLGWQFTTHAWRTIRHHLLECRRRNSLRSAAHLDTDRVDVVARGPGPSAMAELGELSDALARLPFDQADIVRRRFGIDCTRETLRGIGESLGLTKQAICERQRKSMKALKRQLGVV